MRKLFLVFWAGTAVAASPELNAISAQSLRANLSFLSSDALEGRRTPSRGLDVAAEFIASRFRAAGLEPIAAGDSFFQTAKFAEITPRLEDFKLTLSTSEGDLNLTGANVRVRALQPLDIAGSPVVLLPENGAIPPIEGRIVAGDARRFGTEAFMDMLQARRPALILLISKRRVPVRTTTYLHDVDSNHAPVIRIGNEDASESLAARHELKVSVHLSAPERKDCDLRNVGGILRGSDPALREQFIIVSAHYDHIGTKEGAVGDAVYNGANDDGSGTVSVIEIASAFAAMPVRPKRSILFLTWFGEEEGLLGSFYYAKHPVVPLKNTVANLNLEQLGRTDDKAGDRTGEFAFTGSAFSDVPSLMQSAAATEGVKVYNDKSADEYFARSDNYALALAGVISHTLIVAFEFPDYHGLADEWQKIDYENMAKVDRGIAAGILQIANDPRLPRWSELPEAATYREAGK